MRTANEKEEKKMNPNYPSGLTPSASSSNILVSPSIFCFC